MYEIPTVKLKDIGIEPRLLKSLNKSSDHELTLTSMGYSIISLKNDIYGIIKSKIWKEISVDWNNLEQKKIKDIIKKTHDTNFYGDVNSPHLFICLIMELWMIFMEKDFISKPLVKNRCSISYYF